MNIKVFNIRLAKEFCQSDEDRMNSFLNSVDVKLASSNFVTTGSKDFWSATVFYTPKTMKNEKPRIKISEEDLSPEEQIVFSALRQWRNDLAQKRDWSSFRICHNVHLVAIAKANPQNTAELKQVFGFGKARTEKYGEDILSVLNAL